MMNAVSDATMRLHHGSEAVLAGLPTLANSCCHALGRHKFSRPQTNERCLRAMVGATVLFDHVAPHGEQLVRPSFRQSAGAFHKRSPVQIKKIVQVLKSFDSPPAPPVLLDTLRFSTKHLNDDTTPPAVKKLFAP